VFCLTALMTPSGTPISTANAKARPPTLAVIGMRGKISRIAGRSDT